MPEADDAAPKDVNVKSIDWRVVERIGVAVVLLVLLGMHFMRQDASNQSYIQTQADKNSDAIREQQRLDREREKEQAKFMQEKLISVVESQVSATVAQTESNRVTAAASEKTAATNEKVAEKLGEFIDVSEKMVERFDEAIDRIEASAVAAPEASQ